MNTNRSAEPNRMTDRSTESHVRTDGRTNEEAIKAAGNLTVSNAYAPVKNFRPVVAR